MAGLVNPFGFFAGTPLTTIPFCGKGNNFSGYSQERLVPMYLPQEPESDESDNDVGSPHTHWG